MFSYILTNTSTAKLFSSIRFLNPVESIDITKAHLTASHLREAKIYCEDADKDFYLYYLLQVWTKLSNTWHFFLPFFLCEEVPWEDNSVRKFYSWSKAFDIPVEGAPSVGVSPVFWHGTTHAFEKFG